jgi:precorrin-2 dehydrogenase/sirohydrochlorin ferrochelatase
MTDDKDIEGTPRSAKGGALLAPIPPGERSAILMCPATDMNGIMIPLLVEGSGKRVVIFGGGPVAARKAAYFTNDCSVVVVSRSFASQFQSLPVERRSLAIRPEREGEIRQLMEGAFLVITATSDSRVNAWIGSLCQERGILWNNARGMAGDVIFPAVLQGRSFLVAVGTFGKSPAFSRYLRSQLELHREEYEQMIELQERLRGMLQSRDLSQEERSTILWNVVNDPDVWEMLKRDPREAWSRVLEGYLHE